MGSNNCGCGCGCDLVDSIFSNYDLLNVIQSFCGIPEKLNFHRINKTCNLFIIKCYFCEKEPILPILVFSFTKKYIHLNKYSCYQCFRDYKINGSNVYYFNDDVYKLLWRNLDNLNIIETKKFGLYSYIYKHKKCYLKCNKCKVRCFNSIWLYHHIKNNCLRLNV